MTTIMESTQSKICQNAKTVIPDQHIINQVSKSATEPASLAPLHSVGPTL